MAATTSRVTAAGYALPPLVALMALSFFMADVRDGLGPFLAVIMQQEGWDAGLIGTVMTAGGLAGVLATTPAGALVDLVRAKRGLMIAASAIIAVACLALLMGKSALIVTARQLGRNEAANHGGNVLAAGLAGVATYFIGLGGILALQVAMTVGAILAVLSIDPASIDHDQARGMRKGEGGGGAEPAGLTNLLKDRSLLLFGVTMACFHLANASMLPLVGLRLAETGSGAVAGIWTSASIVVAQATMVPMALVAAGIAQRFGYRPIVLAALLALPIRGAIAVMIDAPWGIVPVQMLDGVGAGLLGVATPGVVARLLEGSGRFNAGLGAVMTLQGVGAALSGAVGFWIVQLAGYGAAFATLSVIALVAVPVFLMVRAPPAVGAAPARP